MKAETRKVDKPFSISEWITVDQIKEKKVEGFIYIKPLSVNSAWQGKRFKTKAYKQYERDVLFQLKSGTPPPPPYRIYIEFGFTNILSDIDNPVKCFMDILQKKYGINDRDVYEMNLIKIIVKDAYIKFRICEFFGRTQLK